MRLDDELPERDPPPRPRGWYELLCCGSLLLLLLVGLVVLALIGR